MLLEIEGLTKRYGRKRPPANDGVDLRVDAGQVYGLLGHNGAGKTTLVSQVVGLLRPDAGSIRIDGHDAIADPGFARRACSIQPQSQIPIGGLTPRQAIEALGRLRGADAATVRVRSARLTEALDLGEWLDSDGARLSGGVKRLVSFCMAAVAPGKLVVLDEPTNDVDPVRRRLLWRQVRALADEGAAVLLVTHNVMEAERAVDRLAVLDHGRVLTEGSPAGLKAHIGDSLRLELVLDPASPTLERPQFLGPHKIDGSRIVATIPAGLAGMAASWARDLRLTGRIEEFSLSPATLEDIYVELVSAAPSDAGSPFADATLAKETFDVRAA
jgi:ABC-2 type transport system ATP-binding protein